MCGRYTVTRPGDILDEVWDDLSETALAPAPPTDGWDLSARYNLAPTQTAPLVVRGADRAELAFARWGMKGRTGDTKPLINARLETADRLAAFARAFAHRRCLVPADGFYEWSRDSGQPHWFRIPDRAGFCFAGLWQRGQWDAVRAPAVQENGGLIDRAYCLLTTKSRPPVEEHHDRMPLILHPSTYGLWLGQGPLAAHDLDELLAAAAELDLVARPVSRRVNRVDDDDPALVEPSAAEPENLRLF